MTSKTRSTAPAPALAPAAAAAVDNKPPLLSPSASASQEERPSPPAAEVSPGDGAFSPPNDDDNVQHDHNDHDDDEESDSAEEFAPPAFPGTRNLGKRKRTLMAVSTSANNTAPGEQRSALEDLSSDEEGDNGANTNQDQGEQEGASSNSNKKHQSQMIHRINTDPTTGGDTTTTTTSKSPNADENKKYNDAMLLASLSDVDSPNSRKQGESAPADNVEVAPSTTATAIACSMPEVITTAAPAVLSPKTNTTVSQATTPLRSNVNPNPVPVVESTKPYALLPKPGPGFTNKRGKFGEHTNKNESSGSAPNSPDGRDPKAVKSKGTPAAREGMYSAAAITTTTTAVVAPPQHHHPYAAYPHPPPGYGPPPPGYDARYGPPPPGYGAAAAAAYPAPYPYMSYAPHPSGAYPYHPRAYYPPGHAPPSSSSGQGGGQREQQPWGQYHSPRQPQEQRTNKQPLSSSRPSGPEPVHSTTAHKEEQAPYHPLSSAGSGSPSRSKSHVVPPSSEDRQGHAPQPPPPTPVRSAHPAAGYGPPPPGYDARYAPAPPAATRDPRDPYRQGYPPPPVEYTSAVSRDESSPPRSSAVHPPPPSSVGGQQHHHPESYPPVVNTPPSGHYEKPYDYYRGEQQQQQQSPQAPPGPGSHPGYPHPTPVHSQQAGYHPESPPTPYGGHYGPPPPSSHGAAAAPPHHHPQESYEPFDYPSTGSPPQSSNEAHYQLPATVSHEHEHVAPQVSSPTGRTYHQFRKGGRNIHSEPIVLRKKFSWRNYPELEEYLIANRTDYLRHSALNYTAEQKHFNNRLTEGLLELAAKLNYVFDETCFNFVAVRDRIRCYYKSFVQSSKKRGVVVGFDKAGGKREKQEAAQRV